MKPRPPAIAATPGPCCSHLPSDLSHVACMPRPHMPGHAQAHTTYSNNHNHTQLHTCIHTHPQTTCTHAHHSIHSYTCALEHTYTQSHMHSHTPHVHVLTHSHMCVYLHKRCTQSYAHVCVQRHKLTHTYIQIINTCPALITELFLRSNEIKHLKSSWSEKHTLKVTITITSL